MADRDYSPATSIALLLVASSVGASAALWHLKTRWDHESWPEFLRSLFGEDLLVRTGRQFYNRLDRECKEALGDRRRVFSLVVVQLPSGTPLTRSDCQLALAAVKAAIRGGDIIGDNSPEEILALLPGVQAKTLTRVQTRIGEALASPDLSLPGQVRVGVSMHGRDGSEPDQLLAAARAASS